MVAAIVNMSLVSSLTQLLLFLCVAHCLVRTGARSCAERIGANLCLKQASMR